MERLCSRAVSACWTPPPCLWSVARPSAARHQSDHLARPPRTPSRPWKPPPSRRPVLRSKQPPQHLRCSLEDSTRCVQSCETGSSVRNIQIYHNVQTIQNISVVCHVDISTCPCLLEKFYLVPAPFGIPPTLSCRYLPHCRMCVCKLYMCFQNEYICIENVSFSVKC